MTLKEIQRQIDIALAEPMNKDGTSNIFDLFPRIYYRDLPVKLKKEADKIITIESVKEFLHEFYTDETLEAIAADEVSFNKKIKAALHSARYLISNTDVTPIEGIVKTEKGVILEPFPPVSLIAIDFVEAWKKVTGLTPFDYKGEKAETDKKPNVAITENLLAKAYSPAFSASLLTDFMQMSIRKAKLDKFSGSATIKVPSGNQFMIEHFDNLSKGLSAPAKKILLSAILYLANNNYYNAIAGNIMPTVEIPLIEYGEACGYILTPREMPTPEEQEKENEAIQKRIIELKKDIKRDLTDISNNLKWTGTEKKGRNKGDYSNLRIISSHSISKGYIRINFDIDAATYFVQSYMMQFPNALLKLDNRNQNALALGYKISTHNSMDANANRGTESTLSVKSLLAAAPEIQSIDDLNAKGQRNWKDKIKRPLEKSLDDLITIGLLKEWEYRDPTTGNRYNSDGSLPLTWAQYYHLMVDFTMINVPDQTKRRTAKAEAKAKAEEEKKTKSQLPAYKGKKKPKE